MLIFEFWEDPCGFWICCCASSPIVSRSSVAVMEMGFVSLSWACAKRIGLCLLCSFEEPVNYWVLLKDSFTWYVFLLNNSSFYEIVMLFIFDWN